MGKRGLTEWSGDRSRSSVSLLKDVGFLNRLKVVCLIFVLKEIEGGWLNFLDLYKFTFVDGYGYFIMEKMISYKKIFGKGGVIIELFNKPETKDNRQNPLLLAVLQQTYM